MILPQTGSEQAKQAVLKAVENINFLKRQSPYSPGAPTAPGPSSPPSAGAVAPPPVSASCAPPPYSPSAHVFRNSWHQEGR